MRSDDPVLFPKNEFPDVLPDSTSASDAPDLEFFSTPFAYKVCRPLFIRLAEYSIIATLQEHGKVIFDVHTFALHVYLLRPTSHGAVRLKSANPWQQPSVNPKYVPSDKHFDYLSS